MTGLRSKAVGLYGASLLTMAAVLLQAPAMATILYKGQIVPSWPNIAGPALGYAPVAGQMNSPGTGFFPHPTGTLKGLTLLVDFSDQSGAFTQQEISDWLNLKGFSRFGCNGSVHDLYYDMSNGIVDLQNTVRKYYRAKKTKAYYEGVSGYAGADELMDEVIAAVDADVNFADYDNDKDGTTEAISVVYAGPSVTWGQGLWPHAGWLGTKHDGVTLNRYQMTNMGTELSLYVFSHETGHMLFGWPDLYGFGDYCLMGNYSNPTNPVPVNDFFRADQGWIPLTDITAATNATYSATRGAMGYRYVNPAKSKELLFWSNVQNNGRWGVLAGSGLLMMHYDGSISGNNPPNPLELAVVQADGKKTLDATTWPSPGSDPNDFFRAGYKAEFSSTTTPNSSWNNGTASGLRVYAIGPTAESMQFSVGDGSAGGSPSTGGSSSNGGSSTSGGSKANGGSSSSGGSKANGGSSTSGGSKATGGSSSSGGIKAIGGATSGASATNAGATQGGSSSVGGTAAGGQPIGGSTNSGGALGMGGQAGGGNGAAGLNSGGAKAQGGALASNGGVLSANAGSTSTAVAEASPSGEGDGCNCSVPRRSASPGVTLLFALCGLFGLARLTHRRRRINLDGE